MLLSDFSDPQKIFFLPNDRLSAFADNSSVSAMRTIRAKVNTAILSKKDLTKLLNIRKAYGRQLDRFYRLFDMKAFRRYVIGDGYRALRDKIVLNREQVEAELCRLALAAMPKERRYSLIRQVVFNDDLSLLEQRIEPLLVDGLQGRHWKVALQQAAGTALRWWRLVQTEAAQEIRSKACYARFNQDEMRYVNGMLCDVTHRFFDMMDGAVPAPLTPSPSMHARSLCAMTVATVHACRGRPPHHGEDRSVWFDESCYSVTYLEEEDRTRLDLMSDEPGSRVSVTVNGRLPCREFVHRTGEKKRVPVDNPNKPTIQLVWGESGLFVHISIPLKNRLPVLDHSLRSLMDYAVSSFSPKLPPKTAFLSEWFDGPSYEAVYDVAKDETVISLLGASGGKTYSMTLKGVLPIVDRKMQKNGTVRDIKVKSKPILHFVRGRGRKAGLEIVGNPVAPQWVKPPASSNFVRIWTCSVRSMSGTCAPLAKSFAGCWFDGDSYEAVYDKAKNETTITVRKPRRGFKFSVVITGEAPVRDLVKNADGSASPCRNVRKPTFRLTYPKRGPAIMEILLPVAKASANAPAPEQDPVVPIISLDSDSMMRRKSRSMWFEAKDYKASFDARKNLTTIVVNVPTSKLNRTLTLTVKGCEHLAEERVNPDGTAMCVEINHKPAVRIERVGRDPETGAPLTELRMQRSERMTKDEQSSTSLADPDCTRVIAFDFGYTEVAYDALGNRFGEEFGAVISRMTSWLLDANQKRSKLYAKTRPLPPLPDGTVREFDAAKARRIRENNLGRKKFDARMNAFKEELKKVINRALNQMFAMHAGSVFIIEAFGRMFSFAGLSKAWRRRLSNWTRGVLLERLEFKAAERCVRVLRVPAAYSSQTCIECGYTVRANRHGDAFKCKACATEAHADAKAAMALLLRAHDTRFNRYSTMADIWQHHRDDYENYCKAHNITPLPK